MIKLSTTKKISSDWKDSKKQQAIIGYNWKCFLDNIKKWKDHFLCTSKLKYENYKNDKNMKKYTPS